MTTNLPFLRWLVRHPVVRAGETTTAFLTEYPPLSRAPRECRAPPGAGAFRLNLPRPGAHTRPDVDAAAHDHGPGAEQSAVTAPMPGTVIRVLVAAGDTVKPRQPLVVLEAMKMETPLSSPYEAVVQERSTSPRATASKAERCSSSSRSSPARRFFAWSATGTIPFFSSLAMPMSSA